MKNLLFLLLFSSVQLLQGQTFHKYAIGDTAFCGIVFWVEDTDSLGRQHGLVCAPVDQHEAIRWYNGSYITTGTVQDLIYAEKNTDIIIRLQKDSINYAALAARKYYPDSTCSSWYLPSKTELLYMYSNIVKNRNPAIRKLGNFKNEGYWSSVEIPPDSLSTNERNVRKAYILDFFDGRAFPVDKSNKYRVRAVREFRNY